MIDVELLVVGGGTAGIVAARTAVQLGADVLLAESDRTGGECLWTGCVPSKALLSATGDDPMGQVRRAIRRVEPADDVQTLRAAGIGVRPGRVIFTGPRTATVAGESLRFGQALVATGSEPLVPAGLEGALSTDTFWDLDELPASLVVVGGGSVGAELAQACARLGVRVDLVERALRLLPTEDADAAAVVAAALEADGVGLHLGYGGGPLPSADAVLAAAGRRARTAGLGLPAAGVRTRSDGTIEVDARLRTSNPRIFAAGDVTGHPAFTHVAGVHASTAVTNALLGLRRSAPTATLPRVTFTHPELAAVGRATSPADRTLSMSDVDRAVIDGDTAGFARIATGRRGHIVGATVVGPRAGEVLAELTLAVHHGLRLRDLAVSTHPYPTYGDVVWNAAIAAVTEQLTTGVSATAVSLLRTARRVWLNARPDSPQ